MSRPTVAVAIATYCRPEGLAALLESLAASEVDRPFTVFVVDNDPELSAAATLESMCATPPFALVALTEAEPGIAAARNAALDAAASFDFVCFVDDDEVVDSRWLQTLLDVQQRSNATGVTGPVEYDFETPPPGWATLGSFYTEPGFADGDLCPIAGTNNLLLDIAALRERGLRFDAAFGLTGGSDIVLTNTLTQSGGTIVWAQEAVVRETVPAVRCRPRWLVKRAVRSGNSYALMQLDHAAGRGRRAAMTTRARLVVGGCARVVAGLGGIATAPNVSSNRRGAQAMRTTLRGIGVLGAALDVRVHEYAR